nr:MAG TPA: hypothetical protein [Caudoviricetes sp.]
MTATLRRLLLSLHLLGLGGVSLVRGARGMKRLLFFRAPRRGGRCRGR